MSDYNALDPLNGSFREYRRLILSELERLNTSLLDLHKKVDDLHSEMTVLKVKAGFFGALAGLVPAIVAIIVTLTR